MARPSSFVHLALLIGLLAGPASAEASGPGLGLGTEIGPEVHAAWDIDVTPSGEGLPEGSGTHGAGREIFLHHCAGCHTFDPVHELVPDPAPPLFDPQNFPILAGATGVDWQEHPTTYKTPGSYWPYATTLFDYIRRAMPFPAPQSLSNPQVYDLAAFLLAENGVIGRDETLTRERYLAITMPNHDGFSGPPDPRPDTHNVACMSNCEPVLKPEAGSAPSDGPPERRGALDSAEPSLNDLRPNRPVDLPFDVQLVEVDVGFGAGHGLQSYSAGVVKSGEHAGSWLLVGGRTSGLHKTATDTPAFPPGGRNTRLWAVDPRSRRVASVPLDGLPQLLADALASSNQQYIDDEAGRLWIVGGYGWSDRAEDYATFGLLIAIDVEPLVDAIFAAASQAASHADRRDGGTLADLERFFSYGTTKGGCEVFAGVGCVDADGSVRPDATFDLVVTGGGMATLDGDFVLALGHRFGGEYSYAYKEDGKPFLQEYTCRVLRISPPETHWGGGFEVEGVAVLAHGGDECRPGHQSGNADDPFHRRDLNLVAAIRPQATGNEEDAIAYGGVFTGDFSGHVAPLRIGSRGVELHDEAAQSFCQYSAPSVPLFDAETGAMHTLILGGMGVRYCTRGEDGAATPQCTETAQIVPPAFMADGTILSWSVDGRFSQAILRTPYLTANSHLSQTLLLGSNAEFLPNPELAAYGNGVLHLEALPEDRYTTVGHVFGGIATDGEAPRNVLFRDGPSWASPLAFEVRIRPRP